MRCKPSVERPFSAYAPQELEVEDLSNAITKAANCNVTKPWVVRSGMSLVDLRVLDWHYY